MYYCRDCKMHADNLDDIVEDHECIFCGGCDIKGYDPDEWDREQREDAEFERADDERKYGE